MDGVQYTPDGHRSLKRVYYKNPGGGGISHVEETFYIRDASGNMMSTYITKNAEFTWQTSAIYGSSRIGVVETDMLLVDNRGTPVTSPLPIGEVEFYRGKKRYELSNHLGNVLTVVSDKRTLVCTNGTQHYEAEIIVAQDYYPFGMIMPERSFSATPEGYRFGFNGMERDDETHGEGNSYDFGARIYDSRLGRWMSTDPRWQKYPYFSPYIMTANNPIVFIDYNGEDFINAYDKAVKAYRKSIQSTEQTMTKEYSKYGSDIYNLKRKDFKRGSDNSSWKDAYRTYLKKRSALNSEKGQLSLALKKQSQVNKILKTYQKERPEVYDYFNNLEVNGQCIDLIVYTDNVTADDYKNTSHSGLTSTNLYNANGVGASVQDKDIAFTHSSPNGIPIEIKTLDPYEVERVSSSLRNTSKTMSHELGHVFTAVFYGPQMIEYYESEKGKTDDTGHGEGNPSGDMADEFEKNHENKDFNPKSLEPK